MGSSARKVRDGLFPKAESLVVNSPDSYYCFTDNGVGKLRRFRPMINIMFVCHGNI